MARPSSPSEFIWNGRSATDRAPISYHNTESPAQSSLIHDPIAASTAITCESDEDSFCTCPNCGSPELISSGSTELVHLNRGFAPSPRAGTIDDDYDDCDHALPRAPRQPPFPSYAEYEAWYLSPLPGSSEGERPIQNDLPPHSPGLGSDSVFNPSSAGPLFGPAYTPTRNGEFRGLNERDHFPVRLPAISSDFVSDAESYGSPGARSSVTAFTIEGDSSPDEHSPRGRATVPNSFHLALHGSPENTASVTNEDSSPWYRAGSPLLDAQYSAPPSSPVGSTSTTDHDHDHHPAPGPASAARVHAICLAASQEYLRAHVYNRALRHASMRPCRSRHEPYANCRFSPRHQHSVPTWMCSYHRDRYNNHRLNSEYNPTSSLLHNAGAICSIIWARARHTEDEGGAMQEMQDMILRAERIFAEWRVEEGDDGAEQDRGLWDEEECIHVVGDGFCLALGDEDAMNEIWSGHEGGRENAWASSSEEEFEEEAPLEDGAW